MADGLHAIDGEIVSESQGVWLVGTRVPHPLLYTGALAHLPWGSYGGRQGCALHHLLHLPSLSYQATCSAGRCLLLVLPS